MGVFIIASAGSKTGIQFIVFRAMQGIGSSMCFPTAISILTSSFPHGRTRNIAMASLGFGQPLGFQVGLILGGAFIESSLTWRFPFYLSGGGVIGLFTLSCWCLPKDRPREELTWERMANKIDWIGLMISSTSLGLLSYVFAWVYPSLEKSSTDWNM